MNRVLTIIDRASRAGNENLGFGKEADEGILFSKVGPRKRKDHSQADAAISEKSQYGRARREGTSIATCRRGDVETGSIVEA